MQTTSVRIDVQTHRELKRFAAQRRVTVGDAVRLLVRRARQEQLGAELATAVTTSDDARWLDADLG